MVNAFGDVQREGFERGGCMGGSFAPIRRLDAQLERLENTACAFRDEVNRDPCS